jgi:hypothetical protein
MLSFTYLAFISLLKLLLRSRRSDRAKDIEVIVLRQQLEVVRRQVKRPRLRAADRAFLAAASRPLPHERRRGLLVTPQTLLRWHHELPLPPDQLRRRVRERGPALAAAR